MIEKYFELNNITNLSNNFVSNYRNEVSDYKCFSNYSRTDIEDGARENTVGT